MADLENAVRVAAAALHDAIVAAQAAGYRIQYPTALDQLKAIPISETSKVSVVGQIAPIEIKGPWRTSEPEPRGPFVSVPKDKKTFTNAIAGEKAFRGVRGD